ncbi:MAG TPA: MlaD family protein [Thermoleophilaceae bacterium]|jgi:virulence factor Mce-like protein
MKTRRGTASIVASPVLVGAVTTLIVIVAVFLAYNANNGLPFVPTYDVWAQLPSGANLVKGNDVRVGGFRVGVVDKIVPQYDPQLKKTIARVHLKLDKSVQPLARDTTLIVRQQSALGLKYVEITPGHSTQAYRQGDTIPLKFAGNPVELDDVFSTFDKPTRSASQQSLNGFGDAFAGRGESLNASIQALNPFLQHLTPVMRNLADPSTQLNQFFLQIGKASAEVAPVAKIQADLFGELADTLHAIDHSPANLQASIEKAPPTLDTAIASFKVQQPFLADFADLSHRLRPVAAALPSTLPALNTALHYGTPVLPQTVPLNQETGQLFNALDDLARNPNTLLALKDLTTTVAVGAPLLTYVAPYQTVCDGTVYFLTGLGGHMSEDVKGGTIERVLVRNAIGDTQPGSEGSSDNYRPADLPSNVNPKTTKLLDGNYAEVQHGQPYAPAIDANGNADCQTGQNGYPTGPLPASGTPESGRYPPAKADSSFNADDPLDPFYTQQAGGSHNVVAPNTPGLAGPTFKGVPNLRDVP